MTEAGRQRLAEACLSMGRAFFELGAALEKMDEPGVAEMEREVVGKPVKKPDVVRVKVAA